MTDSYVLFPQCYFYPNYFFSPSSDELHRVESKHSLASIIDNYVCQNTRPCWRYTASPHHKYGCLGCVFKQLSTTYVCCQTATSNAHSNYELSEKGRQVTITVLRRQLLVGKYRTLTQETVVLFLWEHTSHQQVLLTYIVYLNYVMDIYFISIVNLFQYFFCLNLTNHLPTSFELL